MTTKAAIVFVAFIFMIFAANAHAIGISPSRTVLNFTPNAEIPLYVDIINNENRSFSAQLYVRGELAQFVQFTQSIATLDAMSTVRFNYKLRMPASLAGPRTYDTRVGAVEVPSGSSMVGAVAGVEAQLWVTAPAGNGWSPNATTSSSNQASQSNQISQPSQSNKSSTPAASQESAQPAPIPFAGIVLVTVGAALGIGVVITFILLQIFIPK